MSAAAHYSSRILDQESMSVTEKQSSSLVLAESPVDGGWDCTSDVKLCDGLGSICS